MVVVVWMYRSKEYDVKVWVEKDGISFWLGLRRGKKEAYVELDSEDLAHVLSVIGCMHEEVG